MESWIKFVLIAVFILVITVLAVVLVIVWDMPDLPSNTRSKNVICLPNDLGIQRCGESEDLLAPFLNRMTLKYYDEVKHEEARSQAKYMKEHGVRLMDIYSQYYWEMKPAAKLTGMEQSQLISDTANDMTTIRDWQHGRELYYTQGFERYGLRYRNGRLVVPVSGIYFVYSHVDLFEENDRIDGIPNITDKAKPIKHAIYKFNILDEEEIKVIDNIQPHTVSSNTYFNSYSSYISALVELKPGDELSVKISAIKELRPCRGRGAAIKLLKLKVELWKEMV